MERLRKWTDWTRAHGQDFFLIGGLIAAGILNWVLWGGF